MLSKKENRFFKNSMNQKVRERCSVVSKAQKCADRFLMRKCRVTETERRVILLRGMAGLELLGFLLPSDRGTPLLQIVFRELASTWFHFLRATEQMMQGSINEAAVLITLAKKKRIILSLFECSMLASKEHEWLACSPDSVGLLYMNSFPMLSSHDHQLSSVIMITSVAASTIDTSHLNVSRNIIFCAAGDTLFKSFVPQHQCGQLLQ